MPDREAVSLPSPRRMTLRNFSLYSRQRTIDVEFSKGVFCLAGANGLGKSTFLAALNYAITGTVARPDTHFLGAAKFYEDIGGYSDSYFDGRIAESDRELAEVEIVFVAGGSTFKLVRGMFAATGLRSCVITHQDGTKEDLSAPTFTDTERHSRYVDAVLKATGLRAFSQLVFLQWFVLTFDEQRHLLFWSDRIIEQALFLAFGYSADTAEQAEALQRTYDSADSKARNLQWQATGVRKRLEALESALGLGDSGDDEDSESLAAEHARLGEDLDNAVRDHEEVSARLQAARSALDNASAMESVARRTYESAFNDRVLRASSAHYHPVVIEAVEHSACEVCGSTNDKVRSEVNAALSSAKCPLCTSPITPAGAADTEDREKLLAHANDFAAASKSTEEAQAAVARYVAELDTVAQRVVASRQQLDAYQADNTAALARTGVDGATIAGAQSGLKSQIADLMRQKNEALARRDEARVSLDSLRRALSGRFAEMENEFVPLLQDLAHEFLGVPLQVDLERRNHALGLSLSLHGSQRTTADTLSESQRFFVDIALRMAFARKLSSGGSPATLYVDTPEGSLDIAYEERAGRLFGKFAEGSDRLVMTANINTSQLLLELASRCGSANMDLVRMTSWTDLTPIQEEAQDKFEQAYSRVEAELSRSKR